MFVPKNTFIAALLVNCKAFVPSSNALKNYENVNIIHSNNKLNISRQLKLPTLGTALSDIEPVQVCELKLDPVKNKVTSLHTQYRSVLEKSGVSNQCLEKILSHWSAPHRFYHGLNHLEKLLENIEQYRVDNNLSKDHTDIKFLLTTAFFHDVIYETLAPAGKNEDDSILFYRDNIDPKHHDVWVENSIESTKHRNPPHDSLARTFWQFDNAVVYKNDVKGFHQWEKEIRKEYQIHSYDAYKAGRLVFLESCVDKDHPKNQGLFHSLQHLQNFKNFIEDFKNIRPCIAIYECDDSFNGEDLKKVKALESQYDLVYLLTKDESQKTQLKDQLQCKVTSDQIVKIQAVADIKYI